MYKNKKFNIQLFLDNLSVIQRNELREKLPALMDISESTFKRILYADTTSSQEISSTNLIILSEIFQVHPTEILNPEYIERLKTSVKAFENSLEHVSF